MAPIPTVRIKNPNKSGDFVVINESDFDANVHEMFEGEVAAAGSTNPQGGSEGDAGGAPEAGFPAGYRYEPQKGGYGYLLHGEVQIEGPSNGKFQGEDSARAAAIDHAAHAAKAA